MKKYQLGICLGLCTTATILEVTVLSISANAQNCSAYDSSVVTSVRQKNVSIGNILINNNYGPDPQSGSVSIRLYHSDAPDRIFSTWNLAGGESSNLVYNNQNIVIGGDWGIQIVFGNGVTSCIYPVADIGRFENGRYVVTATNIYEGTIPPQPSSSSSNPPPSEPSTSQPSSGSSNLLPPETSPQVQAQKYQSMGGGSGGAKATLNRDGQLFVEGKAVSSAWTTATRTNVFVVGIDRKGRTLFVSKMFQIPTACAKSDLSCSSKRSKTFSQSINPDLAKYVAQIDVFVGDRGDGGFKERLTQLSNNIKASCATYDDLPDGVRAAIAYETRFSGCNPI
jgi:hypothetical protein